MQTAEIVLEGKSTGVGPTAMMPCGHMALYEKDGRTHLTVLHPKS